MEDEIVSSVWLYLQTRIYKLAMEIQGCYGIFIFTLHFCFLLIGRFGRFFFHCRIWRSENYYEKKGKLLSVLKFLILARKIMDFLMMLDLNVTHSNCLLRVSQKWKRMVPWRLLGVFGDSTLGSLPWSLTNHEQRLHTPSGLSNV